MRNLNNLAVVERDGIHMGDRVRWAFRHDLPEESDEHLTDLARRGDKSAFGELYRRHRKAAESTARCLLHSRSDADDAVSDAFTGVLLALGNGRGPRDNFRCYLLACVRNACRVRRPPSVPMSADQLERWSPVLEDPERYVEADTVARAFSSLAPRWQHTLWLTEVEQRPPEEVSERLDLSPNATAALSHRARQAFATAYLAEHVAAVSDKDCARVSPHLAGYVRNQLSDAQLTALERHLVKCTHCSAAVAELRDVNASLRSLVPVTPEALAGAALIAETGLVATSLGSASLGLPGVGGFVKALVAVLLVAPVLTTDIPHGDGRSGRSADEIVQVREAAENATAGGAMPEPVIESTQPSARPSTTLAVSAPTAVEAVTVDTIERPDEQLVEIAVRPPETAPSATVPQPTVTLPTIALTVPQPVVGLVDGVVDDIVRPVVGMVTEPLVETLDEALALMGLGTTGEAVTMLRTLVPLLDGPLLGEFVDELLDITSLAPGAGPTTTTTTTLVDPVAAPPASSSGPPATPPGGASSDPSAPGSPGTPSVTVPSGAAPPNATAPPLLPDLPILTLPSISVPPIVLPILDLPPITLPIISLPPITLPNLLG